MHIALGSLSLLGVAGLALLLVQLLAHLQHPVVRLHAARLLLHRFHFVSFSRGT
jgi:hypothetical protein